MEESNEISAQIMGNPVGYAPKFEIGRKGSYESGMLPLSYINRAMYECMLISAPVGAG